MDAGGADLRDRAQVHLLLDQLRRWVALGYDLVVHLAPPCATFSTARDRSWRTKVRGPRCPQGYAPRSAKVLEGNHLAVVAAQIAAFVVNVLGGSASLENPGRSYMWAFLAVKELLLEEAQRDVLLNMCLGPLCE